ncbi:MAG: 1-acyl-sn-glycerol-3-phosphate acyltransferase [Clostridia bacterium]|nr:1-acyl-sn-glycerol-3-phosphate acyltransferase [Clostridia bacterium]
MYFRHDLDYVYPEKVDEHMITVKHKRDVNLDENYPYLNKSFGYKLLRGVFWLSLNIIVFPLIRLTHGLRIYGKKNLKKHKKAFKNGCITISNHVFMWDFLCVSRAMRPRLGNFPAWKTNLEGANGPLIRMAGGIPIPTGNMRAMVKFKYAMEEVLEKGKWLHFFPEGSMWFFYPDLRPLKKAVFKYAVKYDKPLIPMAMSFRKRKGITKLFTKKPCVDLHIGEPLFVDKTVPTEQAIEKMHKEAYHVMQVMLGVNPGDPTYNEDYKGNNYQKTM